MIWLILFCGIIVVMSTLTGHYVETSVYTRLDNRLKNVSISAARDSVQFYDLNSYADGYIVFNYEDAVKAVEDNITSSLSIDSDFNPVDGSAWESRVSYTLALFDESLESKVFKDGVKIDSWKFTYPTTYTDEVTGYQFTIDYPGAVVSIDGGNYLFDKGLNKTLPLSRASYYRLHER